MPTPKKQTPPTSKQRLQVHPPATEADIEGHLGALIDPVGLNPQSLTAREHKNLNSLLSLLRRNRLDEGGLPWLMESALTGFEKDVTSGMFVQRLVETHLSCLAIRDRLDAPKDQWIQPDALICGEGESLTISKKEQETCSYLVTLLRMDTWFSSWIRTQIHCAAGSKFPSEQCPSPLQVMARLTLDAGEWGKFIKDGRRAIKLRPDLFEEAKGKAA